MRKLIAAALITLISFNTLAEQDKKLPIEAFAGLKDFSQVKLSPNGENLAFVRNNKGTLILMVKNFKTGVITPILQSDNQTVFFDWYSWANDDVLLLGARHIKYQFGGAKYTSTLMYAYNLTNDKGIKLAMRGNAARGERQPQFADKIVSFLPKQKNKILVQGDFKIANTPAVYELDLTTLRRTQIQRPRNNVTAWFSDRQGNVRIAKIMDDTQFTYELLNAETGDWDTLFDYEVFSEQSISILGFDKNPNLLYISALHNGRDALFRLNLTTKERELIYSNDKYDFDGSIFYSSKTGEVAGFTDSHLEDGVNYWDADLDKLYRSLRASLAKDEYDLDIVSTTEDQQKYIVYFTSDSTSGMYLLGDRTKNELSLLAHAYPKIDETVYGGKERISYKARDGLTIEGYLTLPVGYKKGDKLPTIIFPHGGPMARDYANFDYWTALLAYHGYAVLQPNFRGSSGYGYEFLMQSIQGFGLAMQDDLQDGANWLIEQGIAQPEKICIGGASYGGYAALMAVVKHPETFKCAASFAGVSDLEHLVFKARYFTNKEIVRKQFGTDDDMLEANSPVTYAKQINRPILLVHGSDDSVVPVYHSREMEDELDDENKDVTYIELEDGDHYLSHQAHRVKTLQAFLDFFDKHLKN
ncbi:MULTISPECIES: alpha/beta hydrolase family protein [Pseudoalteromonas]|uniref:alpha/beta hydrolase family protein n=1 Tax=Pseudoalteromonas TaxID=53246 RepID=UPI0009DF81D5|nr:MULTISPECIES: S9 family peptidase [Pseudoalteromonas]ATG57515.1 S9 family peptidase [Pseudoalteromonas marina]